MSNEEKKKLVDEYIKSCPVIDLTGGKTLSDYPVAYKEWQEEKEDDKYWEALYEKQKPRTAV